MAPLPDAPIDLQGRNPRQASSFHAKIRGMTHDPSAPTPPDPDAAAARRQSLIDYPSPFPIKVMGERADGFVQAITSIARQFDPDFDPGTIELRESSAGKYLGITITVTATSREQLDELYRTLSTHPMVRVVL